MSYQGFEEPEQPAEECQTCGRDIHWDCKCEEPVTELNSLAATPEGQQEVEDLYK